MDHRSPSVQHQCTEEPPLTFDVDEGAVLLKAVPGEEADGVKTLVLLVRSFQGESGGGQRCPHIHPARSTEWHSCDITTTMNSEQAVFAVQFSCMGITFSNSITIFLCDHRNMKI